MMGSMLMQWVMLVAGRQGGIEERWEAQVGRSCPQIVEFIDHSSIRFFF